MKTLTKMFGVWCWCLCMTVFVFAEKQAVTQEEILNPTLEPLTQKISPEQKLENEGIESIESRKAADLQIIEEKRQAAIDAKLQAIIESNGSQIENILRFENEVPVISEEISDDILKAMTEKGFNSVGEYLDYLAANEAALTKEGAVSFETYLQGLDAKEQAVILEYVLQNSSNEGVIVNNNKMPHFKGFSPERNPMDLDKVEYYENLKANPPQEDPYESTRYCADWADWSDSYGDTCESWYNVYGCSGAEG